MILQGLCRLGSPPLCSMNLVIGCQLTRKCLKSILQEPRKVLQVQWNRTVFTGRCFYKIPNVASKRDQLAVSHPRLYKQFESERAQDNLPKEWDLIFSQGELKRKIALALWISFGCFCALPILGLYGFWEFQYEEDVILASVPVKKTTEYMMFLLLNILLLRIVYRNVRNIPRRIYYYESKNKYTLVAPSNLPWIMRKIEFKATDVEELPTKKLPVKIKPWRDQEYLIHKKIFILPHMCFRSGHDRYWMLRHKDLR